MEKISGIVKRVTYHNSENGWSVLKINLEKKREEVTVTVHQCKVFAGASMDFEGEWFVHPKFGKQFKSFKQTEKKPATISALEKYLGSGLIYGVGPKTSKKIVSHFGASALDIFEKEIHRLIEVEGIAKKKLQSISKAWEEHREISKVMMFLQTHGISTLFAIKIFKMYGNDSITLVKENPYRLAHDFFGIGFVSADQVARSVGIDMDSSVRIHAAILHILSKSKDNGHCYLTLNQIKEEANELLKVDLPEKIENLLLEMKKSEDLKVRDFNNEKCYYSKKLFYDEEYVAYKINQLKDARFDVDSSRIEEWLLKYKISKDLELSSEQLQAVKDIPYHAFSILTGGPGCGKTTTTKTMAALFLAMKKKVILAAPTGRAAQRMSEVIGLEAKTIHRLLEWSPQYGGFKKKEEDPLEGDIFIIDESSMLDISLTASLLKAIPDRGQLVFIGDPDQLPSVGAGNVLKDMIDSKALTLFTLTKVFRQAEASKIIQGAHKINSGTMPEIVSPIETPTIWNSKEDFLFIDSDDLTQGQILTHQKVLRYFDSNRSDYYINWGDKEYSKVDSLIPEKIKSIPPEIEKINILCLEYKFRKVDLNALYKAKTNLEILKAYSNNKNKHSSINFGLNATDLIKKLYVESIPKYLGKKQEIQILTPMIRGSVGANNLNKLIQDSVNPYKQTKKQIKISEKIFRIGDRVIQMRNNYDLGVFNGDIGKIVGIDIEKMQVEVSFPDKLDEIVIYAKENLSEFILAYAITIHKSQGSEFDVVILPLLTQHFKMLFRNLIYTGITRAKRMVIVVGQRKAFVLSIKNIDTAIRQTGLKRLLC